jgi:hypothetical protein
MRVSDSARKINRHSGAIFIHDDWREEKGIGVRLVADLPQSPIAPGDHRPFTTPYMLPMDHFTKISSTRKLVTEDELVVVRNWILTV